MNAGDAMFSSAFKVLIELNRFVPETITLNAVKLIAETCQRLTEGQYLDIDFENRPKISADEYLEMVNGKRSEEHTSELQSHHDLVCRILLEKKK